MQQLKRAIARKVRRVVVKLISDTSGIQRLQVTGLSGDVHDDMPRIQEYGFTSHPHADAEAVAVFLDTSNGLVIAVDDRRYRLKNMEQGEVALYDDEGSIVHLKRGGVIHVTAPTQLIVDTPDSHFTGNVTADGDITDNIGSNAVSMRGSREIYDDHHHNHGDPAGTSDDPNEKMT